jgi:hypothetical protein
MMDHAFAGISGMGFDEARDLSIREHVRDFGKHLSVWLRWEA